MPSSPVAAVSTSKPSSSSKVCRDSRISASSSTISTAPADDGLTFILLPEITAASDMDGLPAERKIQSKSGARPRRALDANFARVLLNDAVGHGETKARAAVLAFFGRGLGGEERVVNSLNMIGCNPRSCVGNAHAH